MLVKKIFVIAVIGIFIVSCNSTTNENKTDKEKGFVAKVDSSMTLLQVAKVNNIGEPFLRTQLGIPHKIGATYTVVEMAQRFNFTLDELRKVIEDRKNKQAAARARRMKAKKKKKGELE